MAYPPAVGSIPTRFRQLLFEGQASASDILRAVPKTELMFRKIRYAGAVLLLAAVYFASAKVGLLVAVAQPVVSSAWPPAGIALAALLLYSVRLWPGITVGAFLLNFSAGVPLAGAAGIAVSHRESNPHPATTRYLQTHASARATDHPGQRLRVRSAASSPREAPNITNQGFDLERFRQVGHDAVGTRQDSRRRNPTDDNKGRVRKAGGVPQASDELIPIHDRHLQIQDDERGMVSLAEVGERRGAVSRLGNLEAFLPQELARRFPQFDVVFDVENVDTFIHRTWICGHGTEDCIIRARARSALVTGRVSASCAAFGRGVRFANRRPRERFA